MKSAKENVSSTKGHTGMRTVISVVVVFAVLAAAVFAVTFALYPYGSKSEVSWSEFRKQQGLDAVCVGTSLPQRSYDPDVVDAELGTWSYNMCTPLQAVEESCVAVKEAVEHHDIRRVYFGVDYWAFWTEQELSPGRPYLTEKWKGDDFFQRFSDLAYVLQGSDWMMKPSSINWLFPWISQRVSFSQVPLNVHMKIEQTDLTQAVELYDDGAHYVDRGFLAKDVVYDYNEGHYEVIADWNLGPLQQSNLDALADLCDYCAEQGIELVVFVPPLTDFNFISMRDAYPTFDAQMHALVEEHGASFYDFNLAVPELYVAQEDYFADHEHCNYTGAHIFSEALADLMQRKDAGEDVKRLFRTYDEALADMKRIALANIKSDVKPSGVQLSAFCYAGSTVQVEYQFLMARPGGEFEVVQDYSPEATCLCTDVAERGEYRFRVNARQVGSNVEFEKYRVCSAVPADVEQGA